MTQTRSTNSESQVNQPRRGLGCGLGIALLLVLLLGAIGVGVALYVQPASLARLGPAVSITAPAAGTLVEVNRPLALEALSRYDSGILRTELYADGALVAAQDSSLANGSNPLLLSQTWQPTTTGRHVLLARSYTADGQHADSAVLYVDVIEPVIITLLVDDLPRAEGVPLPSLADIATSSGMPLAVLVAANPGTDPNVPLLSGTRINLPRSVAEGSLGHGGGSGLASSVKGTGAAGSGAGSLRPPGPIGGAPAAPTGLTVDLSCTAAQLRWADNSPDELGFIVYRILPGSTLLERLIRLPANTTTYTDSGLTVFGEYRYQVASVRNALDFRLGEVEGPGLIVTAAMPGSCVPPASATATDLVLVAAALDTTEAYEGVYCYLQVDTLGYNRVPQADFSTLRFDPANPLHYDLPAQLPNRGRYVLAGHASESPVTLRGDCLGRRGVQTFPLGTISASHARPEWDGRLLQAVGAGGSGFNLHYCIGPNTPSLVCRIPGSTGGIIPPVVINPGDFPHTGPSHGGLPGVITTIPDGLLTPPVSTTASLPSPTNLRIDASRAACDEFTESRASLGCVLFGSPTLQWDWTGNLRFTETTLTGYHVVMQMSTGVSQEWDVRPGSRKVKLAPSAGLPCGAHIAYTVLAFQGDLRSEASEALGYDTEACVNAARLQVTFDTLTLGPSPSTGRIRDWGDICIGCPIDQFELDGRFRTGYPHRDDYGYTTTTEGQALEWYHSPSGDLVTIATAPTTFHFADQNMARIRPDGETWTLLSSIAPGQNVLNINPIRPGESVAIYMAILEYDALFTHDNICQFEFELASRSPADWARVNETFSGTDDAQRHTGGFMNARDEVGCQVSLHVVGQAVP